MKLFKLLAATLLMLGTFGMSVLADEPKDKVKAAFVYVGPTGDHGWTYRHDIGRQQVEEAFGDRVETTFIESVPEGADAERVMTQLALQGYDIIFATKVVY